MIVIANYINIIILYICLYIYEYYIKKNLRLTSVIRSYSFVVTAAERIEYGRYVHISIHTAAETNRCNRHSVFVCENDNKCIFHDDLVQCGQVHYTIFLCNAVVYKIYCNESLTITFYFVK